MNKPLTVEQMLNQPPGWYGKVSFGRGKGQRRARMWCRDYDKKRMRNGVRKITLQRVERYGANDAVANDAMETFKDELRERFPGGVAVAEARSITVGDAIDHYLKRVETRKSPRTVRDYKLTAKTVKALIGADTSLDHLSSTYVSDTLYEAGRKRSKDRLGLLSRAIAEAKRGKLWKGDNPVDDVDPVFDGQTEVPFAIPRGVIAPEDVSTLFAHVADDPQWLAFYFLAAYAGPRASELLGLRRGDYDAGEGVVQAGTKTLASKRFIVLGRTGRALIERLLAHHQTRGYSGEWLFPSFTGRRFTFSNFSKSAFKPTLLAAGLATKIGPGTATNNPERKRIRDGIDPKFTMHEFRHTAFTRDRAAGIPPFFLDAQFGHKNATRHFDPNAALLDYGHPQNPVNFPKRREFAEVIDAQVKSLLPTRRTHLIAV